MRYAKTLVQVVTTVGAAIAAAASDGTISGSEWINVILAAAGVFHVLGAGNTAIGPWRYTKGMFSGATALIAFASSALTGGISVGEWWQIGVMVLGALGVTGVPNRSRS